MRRTFVSRCLVLAVTFVAFAGGLLSSTGRAQAAPSEPDQATERPQDERRGLLYDGLRRRVGGPCGDGFEIVEPVGNGRIRCTHGPDPAPDGVDVRVHREFGVPPAPAPATTSPQGAAAQAGIPCYGTGSDGYRVQLIYVRLAGSADRSATLFPNFATWTARANSTYRDSAAQTAGVRNIRFVTDASCDLVIAKAEVSAGAMNSFSTYVSELKALGFNRSDRKYLTWADTNTYCGIGEIYLDDKPATTPGLSSSNANNGHPGVSGAFARTDNGCWGMANPVEAHELTHVLGGVQRSAPNATTNFHCRDESDIMCYVDAAGVIMVQLCAVANERLLDCNKDDYFNTSPVAGSYLATHWNVANSAFLATSDPVPIGPATPFITSVAGDVTSPATGLDTTPTVVVAGVAAGDTVRVLEGVTVSGTATVAGGATTVTFNADPADSDLVLTGEGDHTLTATATDPSGNASPPSAGFVYTLTGSHPGEFHPLSPARILDTRSGVGGVAAPVGPAATRAVTVAGVGGVPATGVSAVALNVTATQSTAGGYLTVFPSGAARPLASNLNFVAGQTVPNLAVAMVGGDGTVSVYNQAGTTHVIFDVVGWYSDAAAGPAGARYNALSPARILDTRDGTGGFVAPIGASATIPATVTGVGGVPASGVSAVVLNVTATQSVAGGFLTVFPSGTTRPVASNLNFVAGQTVPNLVVAKVGADGKVAVYNLSGTTHVIFDVVGWFGAEGAAAGSLFSPLVPARILDTRNGTGGLSIPVGPAAIVSVPVAGVGGVPAAGVSAVVLNVTVTSPFPGGFLTVFPSGTLRPLASNLNFTSGQTVPNLVVAKVGSDGKVGIFNLAGTTHVIFDVVGWYAT